MPKTNFDEVQASRFLGGVQHPVEEAAANGAVVIASKTVYLTKAGVAAMTLADPEPDTDDGTRITFVATTANAHTVSNAAGSGFNGGGASTDVATFGGAIGDGFTVEAYQGKWYVLATRNVTLG